MGRGSLGLEVHPPLDGALGLCSLTPAVQAGGLVGAGDKPYSHFEPQFSDP